MMRRVLVVVGVVVILAVVGVVAQETSVPSAVVRQALDNKTTRVAFEARADNVGLFCHSRSQSPFCLGLVSRAEENPDLKKVFLEIQARGLIITVVHWPTREFNRVATAGGITEAGSIRVNAVATDEEILAYLTDD